MNKFLLFLLSLTIFLKCGSQHSKEDPHHFEKDGFQYSFKYQKVIPGIPSQIPYVNYALTISPNPNATEYKIYNGDNSLIMSVYELKEGKEVTITFNDAQQAIELEDGFFYSYVLNREKKIEVKLPQPYNDGDLLMP